MNSSKVVGHQLQNKKSFDIYRNQLVKEFFENSWSIYKKVYTQGVYWTNIDKNLADQIFREETWIFGIKVRDAIKTIDHGINLDNKKVGY